MSVVTLIGPQGDKVSVDSSKAQALLEAGYNVEAGQIATSGGTAVDVSAETLATGQPLGELDFGTLGSDAYAAQLQKLGEERASTGNAITEGLASAFSFGITDMLLEKVRAKHGETPIEAATREAESTTKTIADVGGSIGAALLSGGTSLAAKGGAAAGKQVAKQMVGEAVESSAKLAAKGAAKSAAKSAGDAFAKVTLPGAYARIGEARRLGRIAKGQGVVRASIVSGVEEGALYGATRLAGEVLIGDKDLSADLLVSEVGGNALLGGAFGAVGGALSKIGSKAKYADPLADKATRKALIGRAQDKFARNINAARKAGLADDIARIERNLGIDDLSDFDKVLKRLDTLDADDAGIMLRSLDGVELAGATSGQLALGDEFVKPDMLAKSDIANDVLDALIPGKRTPEIDLQFKSAADELTQFLGMGELKTDLARTMAAQYVTRQVTKQAFSEGAEEVVEQTTKKQGLFGKLFGEAKAEAVGRPLTKKATTTAANAAGELTGGPSSYLGRKASAKAAGGVMGLLKKISPVHHGARATGYLGRKAALAAKATKPAHVTSALRAIDEMSLDFLSPETPSEVYQPKVNANVTRERKVVRAAFRIKEEQALATTNPGAFEDGVYSRYSELLGMFPGLSDALVQTEKRKLDYLGSVLPRVSQWPGVQAAQGSRAGVSRREMYTFGEAVRGINNPLEVLDQVASGQLPLEGLQAVKTVYPTLFGEFQQQVLIALQERPTQLPWELRKTYSMAFGQPFDDLYTPGAMQMLQDSASANAYAQAAQQQQQQQAQQGGAPQGGGPVHGNARPTSGAAAASSSDLTSSMKLASSTTLGE